MKVLKKRNIRFYLIWFLLPASIIYITFMLVPVFGSFYYSLFEGSGFVPKEFVGFANYIKLFTQLPFKDRLLNAALNNIQYYILVTILQNIGGLVIALIVTRKFRGSKFFRRITFIPVTISIIVTGYIFRLLIIQADIINLSLDFLNLGFLKTNWLSNPNTALLVIAVIVSWQWIGYTILLYATGIDSIPVEITEAASIDGTSLVGQIRYITLPLMLPVIRMVVVLGFIANFSGGFEIIYAIEGIAADPFFSTDIFGTLFYRTSFMSAMFGGWGMGMGATVGSMVFIIIGIGIFIIFTIFNRLQRNNI